MSGLEQIKNSSPLDALRRMSQGEHATPSPDDNVTLVALKHIRRDGGTQPRAELDQETIREYAEAMRQGDAFPPVVLYYDGEVYWLADGFHRVGAAEMAKLTAVKAEVHQGSRRDAVLHSVGVNAAHGLRRTNADKRRAAMTLLADEEWSQWSNREIARRCKVSEITVRRIREELLSATMSQIDEESDPELSATLSQIDEEENQLEDQIRRRAEHILSLRSDQIKGQLGTNYVPLPVMKEMYEQEQAYRQRQDVLLALSSSISLEEADVRNRAAQGEPEPDLAKHLQPVDASKYDDILGLAYFHQVVDRVKARLKDGSLKWEELTDIIEAERFGSGRRNIISGLGTIHQQYLVESVAEKARVDPKTVQEAQRLAKEREDAGTRTVERGGTVYEQQVNSEARQKAAQDTAQEATQDAEQDFIEAPEGIDEKRAAYLEYKLAYPVDQIIRDRTLQANAQELAFMIDLERRGKQRKGVLEYLEKRLEKETRFGVRYSRELIDVGDIKRLAEQLHHQLLEDGVSLLRVSVEIIRQD